MRVGVNLQMLHPGQIGGMEAYVRELIAHLPAVDASLTLVLFCGEDSFDTFVDASGGELPGVERRRLTAAAFQRLTAADLSEARLDVWFCPLLTVEPSAPGIPAVATIPDLQHETFPEFFSEDILAWRHRHYPRTARTVARLLTLSEFSRQELAAHLPIDVEHIVATPLAAGSRFAAGRASGDEQRRVVERYRLPEGFFYYPANTWPHKNHQRLLAAWGRFKRQHGSCPPLVLTGNEMATPLDLASHDLVAEVRWLGYLSAADLPALYSAARALIFPSLFEGFGIPLIEAMSSGCPILSSAAASLPEVAGDAALYFDPMSEAAIGATLESFSSEAEVAADLRQRGYQRARCFSWQATARQVHATLVAAATPAVLTLSSSASSSSASSSSAHSSSAHSSSASSIEIDEPPLITIVTPSYQQGRFIERTLRSVLEQGYPRLQYLVIDGGSSDETVEILTAWKERYPHILDFVSEPDRGQAHAVNKGIDRARGELVGWLNSDDIYQPGALARVVEAFRRDSASDWLYGRADYLSATDAPLGPYPIRAPFDGATLAHECYLCQPAVFFRRRIFDGGVRLDESLHTCLDYDLWIRLADRHPVAFVDATLAASRIYDDNKTIAQRRQVFREIFDTVKRHYGYLPVSWAVGRAHFLIHGSGPLDNDRPDRRTWALATLFLLRHNRRQPRYLASLGASLGRGGWRWLRHRLLPRRQPS